MKHEYRWATLGCGEIGNELAMAMESLGRKLYSVASSTSRARAAAFAAKYNIEKVYDNPDDVLEDENVDVIYISTPHNLHLKAILKALNNKKHVLCEKSITLNSIELIQAKQAAQNNGVVLAEAITLYHMPLYEKLSEFIATGKLGALRLLQLSFGSYKEYDMANRYFNKSLAGGALLDIGVYTLALSRWFMGKKPNEILSQVTFAPSGADEQASILLKNELGEMATIMLSLHVKQPKRATISFDKGYIEIMNYPRASKATVTYTADGSQEIITAGDTAKAIAYEVCDMEAAINGDCSKMHLDYTTDVIDMMTSIRNEWGLKYPEEL